MDITQEDLLLVLKSVKEDLVNEELEAQKLKAAAEASESSSSSTEDSSPAPMKKAAAECSESESESSESSDSPEKKKSAETEQEAPVDLYSTYLGLGQENINDLKDHLIAATMASMAHAGKDMSGAWSAFKSAKEEVITKSAEEQAQEIAKEVAATKQFAEQVQAQNQKLVEQNTVLEKSLKETNEKVSALTVKFAELAKQPQTAQAASVKVTESAPQVIVKTSQEIVKSLADISRSDKLDDKDREIVSKYTMRPYMTPELQEFFKKIGSGK